MSHMRLFLAVLALVGLAFALPSVNAIRFDVGSDYEPALVETGRDAKGASACATQGGVCQNMNTQKCATGYKSGMCTGASNIKCCLPAAQKPVAKTPAKAKAPANPRPAAQPAVKVTPAKTTTAAKPTPAAPAAAAAPAPTGPVTFAKLKSCFPQGTVAQVKKQLGGSVDAAWITNTCAIRMSQSLNCAGRAVPFLKGETVRGKAPTNFNYIFRVKQLAPQMKRWYGNGLTVKAKAGTRGVPVSAFNGKKGIISFDLTGKWDDATGHFDLWDGTQMVEANHANAKTTKEYFGSALSVTLWQFN